VVTAHRDRTSSRLDFWTYRVGRSHLDRILSIAAEGFNADQLEFTTERSGTRMTRPTLEELISAVAASSLPGDPNSWDNLRFEAYGDRRTVSIDISELMLRVSVSGPDATWVHGQIARFKAILDPIAGEVHPATKRSRTALRLGTAASILAAVIVSFLLKSSRPEMQYPEVISVTLTVSTMILGGAFTLSLGGNNKSQRLLSVTGEITDRKWWQGLSTANKIALGAFVVAAVSAIAASVSAFADVWGS
jgi:hypothetical protein